MKIDGRTTHGQPSFIAVLSGPAALATTMDTETVRVPCEPTFGRTYMIPPVLVELPLDVRTRASLQFVRGLLMLAAGMLGMVMAGAALWMIASHPSEWVAWVLVFCCLLPGLLLAIQGPHQAWTCLCDAAQPEPVLVIRSGDIEDRRAGATIPWTAVSQVRIVYTRDYLAHLRLTFRAPIRARHNPFRAGTTLDLWHR